MRIRKSALGLAVGAGLLSLLVPLTPAQAAPSRLLGVTLYEGGTRLGRFDTANPSGMTAIGGVITGLAGDVRLVGIDRRVQNRRLYGVGNEGGIYLLTGSRASKVGQLTEELQGTKFGVDFNPAANALRVVSAEGQNLRQPFSTGTASSGDTVADATLNYAGATAEGITSVAYTNNDLSAATNTTLFDIDSNLDQVAVQSPANSGNLVVTGELGTPAGVDSGFDVFSEIRPGATAGARWTVRNTAYAALPLGTNYRFYSIDLLTGDSIYIGRFPTRVTDIALDLDS